MQVFRDGVAEGQYDDILQTEIGQLRKVRAHVLRGNAVNPAIHQLLALIRVIVPMMLVLPVDDHSPRKLHQRDDVLGW